MKVHTNRFLSPSPGWRCLQHAAVLLLVVSISDAQRARTTRAKKEEVAVRVRDFEGLGKHSLVKTPVIISRGRNPQGAWLRVLTEYDTYPEWIDELTFHYYVLTETEVERQKTYCLFKQTVRYKEIKQGRRHRSTVFLRPNTVERYGMPVAVAVEIELNGEVVDGGSKQPSSYPPRWWRNPQVVESERVTAKPGYLLKRSETPFALVDIDDYEVSQ